MPLEIYNTLSRSKQPLQPIVPGRVGLYVCGMTVYDYCHLGHARLFMAFDMAQRWMRVLGLDVTYVRNITDVEDKIIRRAAENGETPTALTERMIRYMNEDFAALGPGRTRRGAARDRICSADARTDRVAAKKGTRVSGR